ncbi:hypothetical protein AB0323_13400 [Arthrobacter sp. NPDC080031]|uniref:hypothetical protein n=1 Tax=Arthrobacter sp. NPDC080031 TaxID=3155918 RepID=UPI00344B8974
MSTNRPGRKKGYVASDLTKARQSAAVRRNAIDAMERRHGRELNVALRALTEAEVHLERLEAEEVE